jgi:hypothetical protein
LAGVELAPSVPDTVRLPADIVVAPAYVFAPDNVVVKELKCFTSPLPEITPE